MPACILAAAHQHSARTVAEEHTSAPVVHIQHTADHLAPQHQGIGPGCPRKQAVGCVQRVYKACTGCIQIKTYGIFQQSQLPLEQAGRGGTGKVGRERSHQAHTHLFRFHTGTLQCLTSCLRRHSDAVFSSAAVTARMDTRTAEYPFIAGIHPLGKHFIGDHLCGNTTPRGQDLRCAHSCSFLACPNFWNRR